MITVSVQEVTKAFGRNIALQNIDVEFCAGEITGVLGADGAGKTTLLRLITGLLLPDSGKLELWGCDVTEQEGLLKRIGYMPQQFGMYEELSVQENLALYADLKQVPHDFAAVLQMTGLAPFARRQAGKLSGGMKQKLGLACALLGRPSLLILDEPSVGVDPVSRQELLRMVREQLTPATTVIWATAYLDEAHNFAKTVVLDKGRVLFAGRPQELGANAAAFEDKVIELMGGFAAAPSRLAEHYRSLAGEADSVTVEAVGLCKRYGDFYAVCNNSFQIKKGEIFGLLGPNGAGKSTSFKMMCGLTKPTAGTARIMGIDILRQPSKARSCLGYMAQKFSLYSELSIQENLQFYAGLYGLSRRTAEQRQRELSEIFGFAEYCSLTAGELPLGIKQRLSLACAVIHEPGVLFLDEPTSGVDAVGRREFWHHIRALAAKGVTVLVTTHFMDEAEYCDNISLFYRGEAIALDTPSQLKRAVGASSMEEAFIRLITEHDRVHNG